MCIRDSIDAGLVRYQHDGSESIADSFGFTVDDGLGATTASTFNVNVNPVNDNSITPVVDTDVSVNSVSENAGVGTAVGVVADASVADSGDSVSYLLDNNDGGRFTIDAGTGQVTVAGSIDREVDGSTRTITVRATSTDGSTVTSDFVINIVDVDEFDVTTITDVDPAAEAVDENAANGTSVGYTALASDLDATNNTITYSLQDNAGGRFAIDSVTGEVTVADGSLLDREVSASHDVTVRAESSDGSVVDQNVTILVNDIDEFDIGNLTDINAAANQVADNAAVGTLVGLTVNATDVDATNNVITYVLLDDAGGRFAIDNTGLVTVAGTLDFNTAQFHTIEVQAESTDGSLNTETFDIAVLSTNTAPIATGEDITVASGQSTTIDTIANASDVDGDTLSTVALAQPANGTVTTDASGRLVYTPNAGFLGDDTITYVVSDGLLNSQPVTITVSVQAVNPTNEPNEAEDELPTNSPVDTTTESDEEESEDENEDETEEGAAADPQSSATSAPPQESTQEQDTVAAEVVTQQAVVANQTDEQEEQAILRQLGFLASSYDNLAAEESSSSIEMFERLLQLDLEQAIVWTQWDEYRDVSDQTSIQYYVGLAASSAGVASIGYFVWLLRGGALAAAVTTSLPTWRLIDPATLISAYRTTRNIKDDEIERIITNS